MNDVPMRRGAAPWLAFLLAAAVLWLAAAGPAAAQNTTGTVVSPLFLGKSNLNGATVNVRTNRIYSSSFNNTGFWTVSGVPSGATVSVSSASVTSGAQKNGSVTLGYTGNFTGDFTLTLTLDWNGFNVGNDGERYTIPVLANGTRRLVVGSVMGQATEAGGQSTFAVSLGTPISAAVSVSVSSQDGTEGTVSPSSLTFSTSNWSTAQTVTVTGVTDDVDDGDVTWQVRLDPASAGSGGDSNYHALANVDVDVTTTDDDTAGITVTPTTSTTSRLRTSEDGSTATFTVELDSEPTGNVVLDVASSDTAQGTVDTDSIMSGLQSALTFTTSNWNTAQTVTLTGVDDSPGTADGSQTYTVSVGSNIGTTQDAKYNGLSAVTVYAINADDELGLDVGAVTGQATEAGGTATFTVALLTQPLGAVTVAVSSRDASEGRVSPSSLTFSTSNWNVDQTVTVTGENDDVDDGDVAWAVRLDPASGGSGGDADYHALANVDVAVATTDDDAAPTVALSVSPGTVSEAGGEATVSARLSHPSGADTTVTVTPVAGVYTVGSGAAGTIVIGAEQTTGTDTATVTAVDNDVDAPDNAVTVTGTAANAQAVADGETVSVTGAELTIADDDEKGLVFDPDPAVVVATAGGAGVEYTVALTSEPTGPVDVAVTSDNPDVTTTVSSPPLRFTAADWDTAQTVTAAAVVDMDDVADTAVLTHSASGGGYDGEAGTVDVAVAGSGDVKVEVGAGAGSAQYSIEGRRVTVVVESGGVPDGIELDLAGVGSGPALVLTLAPPAGNVPLESSRYGLGPEGSRTVVDVAVSRTVSLAVCLPVEAGLSAAAQHRPLLLLHYDGSAWESVSGAELSSDGTMMCGSVGVFSPFAVGYADTKPEFDFSIASPMVFTVDEAIAPVTLPGATGGDVGTGGALAYGLGPTPLVLPPGLAFDLDGSGRCGSARTLCGTPTEEFAGGYTWTVRDVDGPVVEEFTIEVVAAVAQARARLKGLNASVLPELSRASWDSAMEAVVRRLESPGGGGGSGEGVGASLAGFAQANEQALKEGSVSWKELLSGQSFAMALGGGGEGVGLGRAVTVWGAGDSRRLSRDVPALKWSGDLFAAHLGADAEFGSGVTGGVGVSWYESRVDYEDRSGDETVKGVHRSRMASVQPYVGWSSPEGTRLWGSVGVGSGEIEIVDEDLVSRFGRQASDTIFVGAAVGGAMRVVSSGTGRVELKGEGRMTRYAVDDNEALIEQMSVRTQRMRVSAEGTREYELDGGGRLSPSAELGLRWDGGDGATGTGVEVGGGLSWSGPGRMTLEFGGRWLVAHRSELEEWGVSGGVVVEPDAGGRGLSLSVRPAWGEAEGGASRLWEEGMAGRGGTAEEGSGAVLEAELGYGVGAFGGFGVATPYTRYGQARDERRYAMGWRLAPVGGEAFELDVEGWRRERGTARAEHGVSLDLRLRW